MASTKNTSQNPDSIPVYEILASNGDDHYYALVSADQRSPGILAIFDRFPIEEREIEEALNHPNMKAVLALSKMQLVCDIENIKHIREEYREATIEKICKTYAIPRDDYSFETAKT